jgi:hypothetical protein
MGVSKSDLIELEFGGEKQADIAERVDQIYRNYEGSFQDNLKGVDSGLEEQSSRGNISGER